MPLTWEKAFRFGGLSVLVFRPRIPIEESDGWKRVASFGCVNLEIMFAAATARRNGSWLYLCEPRSVANRAPFDFEMPNVRRLPSVAMLDRFFNWMADRDQAGRAARNRLRRRLGLPLEGWLLEREYRARILIKVWRLRLAERRLAWRLRVMKKATKLRQASFPRAASVGPTIEELQDEHRSVARLIREYRKNFVRTCTRNPLDCKTFWSYERQRRLAKLTVEGQGRTYFKRRLIAEIVPFRFCDADRDRLEALLRDLGIEPDAKLITLHVREGGFKRGLESQDKGMARGLERDKIRDESSRNATIENYFPAIRHLIDAGYTIVRIGDSSMTPLSLPSVVDVATLPGRDPALDYYCVSRSEFFIACDSGPWTMSWMVDTPVLALNAIHALLLWPINKRDLVVPKYIREIATGRFLTLRETCERRHTDHVCVTSLYDYLELTPQDVLAAVQEMEKRVEAAEGPNATPLQEEYHRMYLQMMDSDTANGHFTSWGPDDGFVGNGAIAQFVVERDAAIGWQPLTDATSDTQYTVSTLQQSEAGRQSALTLIR
jgi:putative glycosyltransferase (TIGR04372 family)